MREIRIGTVQFEVRDNDTQFNLSRIDALTAQAVAQGAEIVSFPECCIQAYTWVQPLSLSDLLDIAEEVPTGPSIKRLIDIARSHEAVVMAGLFERENGKVYNTYVTVGPQGYITKYRKLHTFINPHLTPGSGYNVIDLLGCKVGFLICYDNNLIENPRMTALLGAEIIFAPHVTGCLPDPNPGRGTVARELWDNREKDPVRLRMEFDSMKGRGWLMKWLPSRAYENGVYYVFSNPVGWDYENVKPGLAMILDPNGDVLTESRVLGDDVVVATLTPERLINTPGSRYRRARRPDLYDKLVEPQQSLTQAAWQVEPAPK